MGAAFGSAFSRAQGLAGKLFGRSGSLVLSRVLSAAITFALPLVLVRLVDPTGFGTYKQFFLVANTVLLVGKLGLSQSLYYFLPRDRKNAGAFAAQTFLCLTALGLLAGVGIYWSAPMLAHLLESPGLLEYRGSLALYAAGLLASSPLEGTLVGEGRFGRAAVAYTVTDALRAGGLIAAAALLGVPWLFRAAAAVTLLRVVALWVLAMYGTIPFGRPTAGHFRTQLAYALPFAGSAVLWVAQKQFSQYAVSASFDPATFALFSVAAFHMQVVDIVYTPTSEVLMVELAQAPRPSAGAEAFRNSVARLATILFPATAGAWLLGSTVLPLLFTNTYLAAVPLFMLATLEIPIWVLPVDAVLRAHNETRYLLWFSAVRIAMAAAFILGGIHLFGLAGAIGGGIATEAVSRVFMLSRGCRHFEVGPWQVFDWPALGRIALSAAVAAAVAWPVRFVLSRAPMVVA